MQGWRIEVWSFQVNSSAKCSSWAYISKEFPDFQKTYNSKEAWIFYPFAMYNYFDNFGG